MFARAKSNDYLCRVIKRLIRKDAGVVDRGGLENRCALAGTQGSNPCLSAKSKRPKSLKDRLNDAGRITKQKTADYQLVLRFSCLITSDS